MPNIVVIGASAGGIDALRGLVRGLPPDLPAAIFVVIHLSPLNDASMLANALSMPGRMKVAAAHDGEPIQRGRVYVARPDLHMLVEPGYIRLTRGPRENRHRPGIDPLFRSAARAYGRRVLGIVLSGMLDDGAIGLQIVKSEGGVAVVQDPVDAMFDSMPRSAMRTADFVLKAADMSQKIIELACEPWQTAEPAREVERVMMGSPSMRDGYSDSVEGALWTAVRILEESASLERKLADEAAELGNHLAADRFNDVARSREEQAGMIRDMLLIPKRNPEEKPTRSLRSI